MIKKEILLSTPLTDISTEIVGFKKITFISKEPSMNLFLKIGNNSELIKQNQTVDIVDNMLISKISKSIVNLTVELQ